MDMHAEGREQMGSCSVSVILPTRNRPAQLTRAIESALAQSHKRIEIVVVDDASDCDVRGLVKDIDPNIVFHRFDKNVGGSGCRNQGAKLASGSYLAFLDDDDVWSPRKIERQLDFCAQNAVDLCYTGRIIKVLGAGGEVSKERYSFSRPRYRSQKKSIMWKNFIGTTSSILVRRDSFWHVGGFDVAIPALQDYDFYINLIFSGFAVAGLDEPLVDYFVDASSDSISKSYVRYQRANARLFTKYANSRYFGTLLLSRARSSITRAGRIVGGKLGAALRG